MKINTKLTYQLTFIILFAITFCGCQSSQTQQEEKPNVLFIIADDLADRLPCYGDTVAVAPNLDLLAQRGVVFGNNFCQYPTCGPSRASLLSGLYPFESGYTHMKPGTFNEHLPGVVSLPHLFRKNGYFTARVGKIFHMGIPAGIGGPGTDDNLAWDVAVNNTGYDASQEVWDNATHVGEKGSRGVKIVYSAPDIEDTKMADGQGLENAIQLLTENHPQKTGKPFFLAYGIYRPHPPMIVPKKHWDAIDISKYKIPEVPENDRDDIPEINWHLKGENFNFIPDTHGVNYAHAYYAAIHFVDDLAGKLIDELKKQKLAKNTIIVFSGDQGFHLGEHGHWHKSSMFEEACRVPLIIVDPRQKEKAKTCTNLTGLIDIYPTLCELTGIEAPHKLSGLSLKPQLNDVNTPGKAFEFTMGSPKGYGIRTEKYRYTEWREDSVHADFSMLYDLEKDPNEFKNLVDEKVYEKIVQELNAKLTKKIIQ
ncbi:MULTISPECIES: sulfatase [unclassified Saccharicrinis]|uniref:sulfatase n=1 Tax=unclassified Saccharicrinis TaxID=2646859 RepID=UPI003D341932